MVCYITSVTFTVSLETEPSLCPYPFLSWKYINEATRPMTSQLELWMYNDNAYGPRQLLGCLKITNPFNLRSRFSPQEWYARASVNRSLRSFQPCHRENVWRNDNGMSFDNHLSGFLPHLQAIYNTLNVFHHWLEVFVTVPLQLSEKQLAISRIRHLRNVLSSITFVTSMAIGLDCDVT